MLKTQNTKIWHLIDNKENVFIVAKLKQKSRGSPGPASSVNMHIGRLKFLASLCMSKSDHKSGLSIEMGAANKF